MQSVSSSTYIGPLMGSLFWLGRAKGSPGIGMMDSPLAWAFLAQVDTRSVMRDPVATLHLTLNSNALSGLYLPKIRKVS